MKLLKKINNNFALAEDSKGEQVIVEGSGVGFQKMPCELNDLSSISRTYYGFNSETIRLIQTVNPQILQIADQIYNEAVDQIPAEPAVYPGRSSRILYRKTEQEHRAENAADL